MDAIAPLLGKIKAIAGGLDTGQLLALIAQLDDLSLDLTRSCEPSDEEF